MDFNNIPISAYTVDVFNIPIPACEVFFFLFFYTFLFLHMGVVNSLSPAYGFFSFIFTLFFLFILCADLQLEEDMSSNSTVNSFIAVFFFFFYGS